MSEINKEHIENRVSDWRNRIINIFSLVKDYCLNYPQIELVENKTTRMHEELMQKYNVSPVDLPVLELMKNKELLVSFKPMGLWVIGANGRIDILTKVGAYILVDVAEKEEPPNWKVYAPNKRKDGVDFDNKFIAELIES
jgi:hypothetical protein